MESEGSCTRASLCVMEGTKTRSGQILSGGLRNPFAEPLRVSDRNLEGGFSSLLHMRHARDWV
eukprot:6699960-Prorocentrum_lima.AAC.1